ncbi:MAG: hypothetical protein KF690_02810 [Bacteroidetes bacterium]|nr:hypothetical protein [Bacteroidota bacterium]
MKHWMFCMLVLVLQAPLVWGGDASRNAHLVALGKAYKDYMFANAPSAGELKGLSGSAPQSLAAETSFILETISTHNKLLSRTYLVRPSDKVLKNLYIIRRLNWRMREESAQSYDALIDSLDVEATPVYELVDSYYSMLFTGVGNKNKPFDLSKADLKLREYGFADDTEQGIFFLRCFDFCGRVIWGYMNVVNPPNTRTAYEHIRKYPKVNGSDYFRFTDLYFPDFEMVVEEGKGRQSYKSYYLDKYYELLLSHLLCLTKEGAGKEQVNNLLLGSILKNENLYKYTQYKSVLEQIFSKVEK